tara:strand:- start:962 stop:1495 length:534 start_codon:yes stop_codon:yes gene_type:complete
MISNIAKNIVSENSEENIVIAIWWKRAIAYSLDAIFVVGILFLFTKGQISFAWELSNLFNNFSDWIIWFLVNWILIFAAFWLYFKYTGKIMQRSLGQRFMKLAIIYGDGTMMPEGNWGKRAFYKLRYTLPLIGIIIGIIDLIKIMRSETHQSRIDWYNNTIVVMEWSLPVEIRSILK